MWTCASCNQSVPAESKFCPYCGSAKKHLPGIGMTIFKVFAIFGICIATLLLGAAGACFGLVGAGTSSGGLLAASFVLFAHAIGAVAGIVALLRMK